MTPLIILVVNLLSKHWTQDVGESLVAPTDCEGQIVLKRLSRCLTYCVICTLSDWRRMMRGLILERGSDSTVGVV